MKLLVLDIAIDGTPTTRRVRVPAELTLADLHAVIQAVLGWDETYAHRFKLGGRAEASEAATRLTSIFTEPAVSIGYMYDDRYAVTVAAVSAELGAERSNDDFACLSGDATCDIEATNARLRGAFVTVSYHADRDPSFATWHDAEEVRLFEEAVRLYLGRREPHQSAAVLRERAKLQAVVEELLAAPSMTIMRATLERLRGEGLARAEAIDALVALAASFPGEVSDPREQAAYLMAVQQLTAAICRGTFADGPGPVIATQLALRNARDRNKRRRKRH